MTTGVAAVNPAPINQCVWMLWCLYTVFVGYLYSNATYLRNNALLASAPTLGGSRRWILLLCRPAIMHTAADCCCRSAMRWDQQNLSAFCRHSSYPNRLGLIWTPYTPNTSNTLVRASFQAVSGRRWIEASSTIVTASVFVGLLFDDNVYYAESVQSLTFIPIRQQGC